MNDDELALRKRRLSPKLLGLQGVSGVGLGGGQVIVYLEEDAEQVRRRAREVADAEEPGTPLAFRVTGAFQKI